MNIIVVTIAVFLSAVPCARADALTWTGASNADWFNVTNWNPNAAAGGPFPADQLTLDAGNPEAGINTTVTTDLGGSITLNNQNFFSSAAFDNLVIGSAGAGMVTVNGADFSADTVSLNNTGSKLDVKDTFFQFFVGTMTASNSGAFLVNLVVTDAPALIVDNATFNSGASMAVGSGRVAMASLTLQGLGTAYQGTGGAVETSSLTLSDGASVTISGSHNLTVTGTTTIAPGANPVEISTTNANSFRTGTLVLNGGQLNAPNGLAVSTLSGSGTVNGAIAGGKFAKITATGSLILGDPTSFLGFNHGGLLDAGINMVTLNAAGFANLGILTTLNGGTLQAANGVALGVGDNLSGSGQVNAKLAAASGSTIKATGNLTLGDATKVDGFFSDGSLIVGGHTVTLHDANEAALGSLTTLGNGVATPGTLVAANGLILEFGKNITGFGTINTPNDPTKPLINNGFIGGNSVAQPITLNGYIKGVGTFGEIVVNGTLAPGFSPGKARVEGTLAFGQTARFEAEIAGTTPGAQHDQVAVTANVVLNGMLSITLLDGFIPDYSEEFDILTAGTRTGKFDQVTGAQIAPDKTLAPVYDRNGVGLTLVTAIPGDANLDGTVNGDDLLRWQANLFSGDEFAQGNFNLDGTINGDDLLIWQANLFNTVPIPAPAASPIPEPGTLGILIYAGLLIIRRHRAV